MGFPGKVPIFLGKYPLHRRKAKFIHIYAIGDSQIEEPASPTSAVLLIFEVEWPGTICCGWLRSKVRAWRFRKLFKEGKHTIRRAKASCHRFAANEARLKMGFLAYNLLHLIRRFYLWGEDRRRSIEWIIMRLIRAGARIAYHARYWQVHNASAFPLQHHYRAVIGRHH